MSEIATPRRNGKLIATLIVGVLLFLASFYRVSPLKIDKEKGINTLEKIELGGAKQWISIRGQSTDDPILLFLHGGPGSANLALLRTQCLDLEKHFVVVNWDQRGAGKTYSPTLDKNSLTIEQIVNDTHELIVYLKNRFGVEKIYLMGFSWGTVPGLSIAAHYPEDIFAYISVGQMVNPRKAEELSLDYVRRIARETNNEQALTELEQINPTYLSDDWYRQLMIERKWLLRFGGVYHTLDTYNHEAALLFKAPEYSLVDFAFWPLGSAISLKQLQPMVMEIDFDATITQVDVPVYFFVGKYDFNTPYELIEAYYNELDAPAGKKLIWFENSAHSIFWDEPERIAMEIIRVRDEEYAQYLRN